MLEQITQFDLVMDNANLYSIGIILATIYDCIMDHKKHKVKLEKIHIKKALLHLDYIFNEATRFENHINKYIKYLLDK